jgi:beta-N-acetylhexosaminidase
VVDSHLGLPRVGDPRALLEERDLAPFAAVVRAGVKCVMTAHVVFPAFDDRPATMSPVLLGHLRDRLGFDGVIVSDALDMSAISKGVGRGEGAVRSLSAGVDLVCIGNPAFPERYDAEARLDEIASAIDTAVREGRVTTTRLEEAAARASALRGWVTDQPDRDQAPDLEVGRRVAARALRLTGDVAVGRAGAVVLDLGGEVNIAAGRRDQRISEALVRRDPDCRLVSVASNGDLAGALAAWPDRPLVVVLRHPEREEPRAAMRTVLGARPDAVVVCTGPFTDANLGNRVVWASGGGRAVAEAVADVIVGDLT